MGNYYQVIMALLIAWTLSCSQYRGAIQRLYADPYFQQPQYHQQRRELHEFFKSKTWPECLEVEA